MRASRPIEIARGEREAAMALAGRRKRVVGGLGALMIAAYFGFMGAFAFAKPLLGTVLAPGLTLCLVLGPALVLLGVLVSLAYVLWANLVFDPAAARCGARATNPTEGRTDAR